MNKTSFSIIRMTLVACPLLWACQEETVPGLSGKEGEVKEVQLAFSVSAAQPNTRMSDAFVNGNTNGVLKDLSFVPFRIDGTSVQNTAAPISSVTASVPATLPPDRLHRCGSLRQTVAAILLISSLSPEPRQAAGEIRKI